jgi:hypothetical protein
VKISKEPSQLMVEIEPNSKYFIILLICDNIFVLIFN